MLRTWIQLLKLFSRREKKQIYLLFFTTTINGLVRALGIVSVMPFIALVSEPSLADSNLYLVKIKEYLPESLQDSLLFFLGGTAFLIIFLGNVLVIFDYWLTLRFFNVKEYKLSINLLNRYLNKDYLSFGRKKISEMSKNVLSEIDRVVIGALLSIAGLISDGIIAISIVGLLIYVNFWVTLLTSSLLGLAYFAVHLVIIREIKILGNEFSTLESKIYSSLKQALELFKEIKIARKKTYFARQHSEPAKAITRNATRYGILRLFPEQIIEVFAFGLIIFIALYFSSNTDNSANVIGSIAFFAFAVYRLIPVLKDLFDGAEDFQYLNKSLFNILKELENDSDSAAKLQYSNQRLSFKNEIRISNLSFKYEKSNLVIDNLSTSIPATEMTCITGASGVGKSTLLDLILGVIEPLSGQISIDSRTLNTKNIRSWMNGIGYVPSSIRLLEASVLENIAFGIPVSQIDRKRVIEVAKFACLDAFVTNELNDGYQTIIGDGGQILSGGQSQRIAIARSLYHSPHVLLLDEATNELDNPTEKKVLDNIENLKDLTIIFVTHKPSVYQRASNIIDLSSIKNEQTNTGYTNRP